MGRILIYTASGDASCTRAKEFLQLKKVPFVEINLSEYPKRMKELKRLSGKKTVPQIFFNTQHIGVSLTPPSFLQVHFI